MPRRILTKDTIDELLAAGTTELRLDKGDIVTALAKEYALERGLRLVPAGADAPAAAPAAPAAPAAAPTGDAAVTGAAVRKAVVAALGYEPDGLDAAISKALK
ncbi:MAG: hypothetical protein Q4G35_04480 [Propionibacteriaceae bacterium]|nr:hypothetical protein [Propionibacteriaceae bacterium]